MKKFTAKFPSNIALVKYWGKYGNQLPCNASLSMTLSEAYTETTLQLLPKTQKEIEISYFFEEKPNLDFEKRVKNYILQQREFTQLFKDFALRFDSKNSFPHSTGIASSASAFAAIAALMLKAIVEEDIVNFNQIASRLARLGSGSASRSFYGPYALWGKLDGIEKTSNKYAIPVQNIHANFQAMNDAILIVENTPKKVSSSLGHSLMRDHPYAAVRFKDANLNCVEMLNILQNGDYEAFIAIVEREALSLHAMMMTSKKYYMLMQPETMAIINEIISFREDTKLPFSFTLDAGPNIHLIYPSYIHEKFYIFVNGLQNKLKAIIYDRSGKGGEVY